MTKKPKGPCPGALHEGWSLRKALRALGAWCSRGRKPILPRDKVWAYPIARKADLRPHVCRAAPTVCSVHARLSGDGRLCIHKVSPCNDLWRHGVARWRTLDHERAQLHFAAIPLAVSIFALALLSQWDLVTRARNSCALPRNGDLLLNSHLRSESLQRLWRLEKHSVQSLNICSMNIGVGGSSHLRRRATGIETSEHDEKDTKSRGLLHSSHFLVDLWQGKNFARKGKDYDFLKGCLTAQVSASVECLSVSVILWMWLWWQTDLQCCRKNI